LWQRHDQFEELLVQRSACMCALQQGDASHFGKTCLGALKGTAVEAASAYVLRRN